MTTFCQQSAYFGVFWHFIIALNVRRFFALGENVVDVPPHALLITNDVTRTVIIIADLEGPGGNNAYTHHLLIIVTEIFRLRCLLCCLLSYASLTLPNSSATRHKEGTGKALGRHWEGTRQGNSGRASRVLLVMDRLQIPLHKKIPISLMPRSSSSSLILFGYSFLPESVEQEGRERESLLSVATDGSVSLIAGYKSKQSIRNNIGINGGDDDEDLIEDALHLTGTMSKQSEADYVMKIPHGVETNVELLPLAGAIAGLKRDRRNEFSRVDDKLSKAARTSLKEKQRAISQSRRRKLGEKKEEKTSTDDDAAKNTTEPAV